MRELLRWAIIAGCGGVIIWILAGATHAGSQHARVDEGVMMVGLGILIGLLCLPFLLVALFCWHRRYHLAVRVVLVVGLLVVEGRLYRLIDARIIRPHEQAFFARHQPGDLLFMCLSFLPLIVMVASYALYVRHFEPHWFTALRGPAPVQRKKDELEHP